MITHSANAQRPRASQGESSTASLFNRRVATRGRFRLSVLAFLGLAIVAAGAQAENCLPRFARNRLSATLELSDGSRLVGVPQTRALALKMDFTTVEIPLVNIRQCEIRHKEERVLVKLQNGDQMTGMLTVENFPIETALGNLMPGLALIDRITFTEAQAGGLPLGDGPLRFGNVNWTPWRTMFEVQGDKLVTLPKARPGFNYGHWGNGRSAALVSSIGSHEWKDYSVEFELGMIGVNPAFNPHGLPADYRSGALSFHVADSKESWNVKGESSYAFSIQGDGSWSLACGYNHHSPSATGWFQPFSEGARTLASGKGLRIDTEKGNKIRLDVIGTRIQIWVDDESIVDIGDEKMSDTFSGQTLDHGGIGISWGWECMGWIRNFSAKRL